VPDKKEPFATARAAERRIEQILKLIDRQVKIRGDAERKEMEATERIAQLASEARRSGASMKLITKRIKRLDHSSGELKPVTRQAADTMIAVIEGRREPRTTRASRRRREEVAAGHINHDAFK
jgi:hypothetical protein